MQIAIKNLNEKNAASRSCVTLHVSGNKDFTVHFCTDNFEIKTFCKMS